MVTTLTDFQEQNRIKVNITYLDYKVLLLLISTKKKSREIAKVGPRLYTTVFKFTLVSFQG